MFQEAVKAESPTLSAAGPYLLPAFSLRGRITAAIIREEAAESLLPGIRDNAEFAALVHVLNSYTTQWWLKHLSCVGADPATYWKAQLGERSRQQQEARGASLRGRNFPGGSSAGFLPE